MYVLAFNVVLAAVIAPRYYEDYPLSVEVCTVVAAIVPLIVLVHYATNDKLPQLKQLDSWSAVLPAVVHVIVLMTNDDDHYGFIAGSFLLAMWVFSDAKRARKRDNSTGRLLSLPPVLLLLAWSIYELYDARFIPWGTLWLPSLVVLAYLLSRFVMSLVKDASLYTFQDDLAWVLFVVIITYALFAKIRPVTTCMQADNDHCAFGSSTLGTGLPISNGCKCLTPDWQPILLDADTGGMFDVCLNCATNKTNLAPGTDCCGVPLSSKLIKLLNCVEPGRDRCVCGSADNTEYNNETSTYACLY